jgi:hypothetical protein
MNLKNNFLLTFEWDAKDEILEIHANREGLEKLRTAINTLLSKNGCDHIHLMTEDWGGEELSNEKQCQENEIINHVKVFQWTT